MQVAEFQKVVDQLSECLDEFEIEHEVDSVWSEKEWTDFRIQIKDHAQMKRINDWLQDDLKAAITDWPNSNIEISAPNPLKGKEDELRVRVYQILACTPTT